MDATTVLVLGGTGKTGRRVVAALEERGVPVRAASRSGATRFDWSDRATWAAALEGVGAVYVMAPDLGSAHVAGEVRAFTAQALAAGVGRTVLLSVPVEGGVVTDDVLAAERALADSGLGWTILRVRWFFQNFSEDFLRDPVMAGELRLPTGEGREGFIDADDIAAVAAAALVEDSHAGWVYELTGPRLMTFGEAAAEIARASGRELRYESVSADVFVAEQLAQGVPEDVACVQAALYVHLATDVLATLTDDVQAVLGRPPRDFADYARAAAAQGAW
jgi:uncharacterized protein YbjT (DUF2867 family)